MAILLIKVPVSAVTLDENLYPDREHSQILEHLVRYCAKFEPLPAITISVEGSTVTVVRGHKYLIAARILKRPTIQAVVASPPLSDDVKHLLARDEVEVLDWDAIKALEDSDRTPKGWHVFFFDRPLSTNEKRVFDETVWELFADRTIQVHHDDTGPAAEFEARTPVTDEAWARRHLEVFGRFDREHAQIASFQGRRFPRFVPPG